MTRWGRALVALLLGSQTASAQSATHSTRPPAADSATQRPVHIALVAPGTGAGPALLDAVLARPHRVVAAASSGSSDSAAYVIPASASVPTSIVILSPRGAVVDGTVRGDVVVIGGDLYVHPGAAITGRAVAIGGGVYPSALARVDGEVVAFRDFTYDVAPTPDGYALSYRTLAAPQPAGRRYGEVLGLSMPTYDRSNGLSIAFAPTLRFAWSRLRVEPSVTYRSQRGTADLWGTVVDSIGSSTAITIGGGRTTRSNDDWIRSDLANSLESLVLGEDARNYYSSTRGEVVVSHRVRSGATTIVWYVGALDERDADVGPDSGATSGPWSLFGRHGLDDMLRPNPPIATSAPIVSGTGGATGTWSGGGVTARLSLDNEVGTFAENGTLTSGSANIAATSIVHAADQLPAGDVDGLFAQTTLDGRVSFPTFGSQWFTTRVHTLMTWRGTAPEQRWSYLGGPGTIPTLSMLQEGGDHLLFIDARYNVPLDFVHVPLAGRPVVALRDVLGSAGVGALPALHEAVGVRVLLGALYAEYLVDPVARRGRAVGGVALGP